MTDIQERQELENKIKQCNLNLFAISNDKSEPVEEFRAVSIVYLQGCELLRQYSRKYGQEAEEQLCGQLEEQWELWELQKEHKKENENGK